MAVSISPCTWRFPKIGVPLFIIHFNGIVPYKPSIFRYPHYPHINPTRNVWYFTSIGSWLRLLQTKREGSPWDPACNLRQVLKPKTALMCSCARAPPKKRCEMVIKLVIIHHRLRSLLDFWGLLSSFINFTTTYHNFWILGIGKCDPSMNFGLQNCSVRRWESVGGRSRRSRLHWANLGLATKARWDSIKDQCMYTYFI